jgi:hypothetical protein
MNHKMTFSTDSLAENSEKNQRVRVKTWLTIMVDYAAIPSI